MRVCHVLNALRLFPVLLSMLTQARVGHHLEIHIGSTAQLGNQLHLRGLSLRLTSEL